MKHMAPERAGEPERERNSGRRGELDAALPRYEREYDVVAEIRNILGALARRWKTALLVALAVILAGIAYLWLATTLYSSSVEILIDPRQRQTVESEVTPSGLGTSAAGADTLLLESQVELLNSHNTFDALIRSENLDSDPEFAGSPSIIRDISTAVKSVLYGPTNPLAKPLSPYDRTLRKLRERIDIGRKRNTYVISITVRAEEAEKAANLANKLAAIYVSDVNEAGSTSTREAATALTSRLEALRASVDKAARAVAEYKKKNNLIDTNSTLVVEQQLSDLNRELSRARLDLQTAQARRNQFRAAVRPAASADGTTPATGEGASAADAATAVATVSDIGESTVVSSLQTRLADIESQLADLALVYQDRHPRLRRLRQRRDALQTSLNREFGRVSGRLDLAYRTALEKAEALEKDVKRLEERVALSNESSVQLRELEREAASVQAVYESFLRRSKQANEQVDIPQSTARIISFAYPGSRPSHPRAILVLLGSIGLGGVLGVGTALAAETFGGRKAPKPMPRPVPSSAIRTVEARRPERAMQPAPRPEPPASSVSEPEPAPRARSGPQERASRTVAPPLWDGDVGSEEEPSRPEAIGPAEKPMDRLGPLDRLVAAASSGRPVRVKRERRDPVAEPEVRSRRSAPKSKRPSRPPTRQGRDGEGPSERPKSRPKRQRPRPERARSEAPRGAPAGEKPRNDRAAGPSRRAKERAAAFAELQALARNDPDALDDPRFRAAHYFQTDDRR